jgi:hypothetical protein
MESERTEMQKEEKKSFNDFFDEINFSKFGWLAIRKMFKTSLERTQFQGSSSKHFSFS